MPRPPDPRILASLQAQATHQSPTSGPPCLAVDYGTSRCGLAYSPDGLFAHPAGVCPPSQLPEQLATLSAQHHLTDVVWGLPIGADGTPAPIAHTVRTLAQALPYHSHFIDERHSTQLVRQQSPSRAHVDDLAAAQLIEWWWAQLV